MSAENHPTLPIAVVVVRWKGGHEVDRCLESLISCTGPGPCETVLVDSGSGDGGAERLAAAFPRVRTIGLEHNRGFAAAANHGVESTEAKNILLLNPDTQILDNALETLISELESRPQAAGVVPLLQGPDGVPQWTWQLRKLPRSLDLCLGRGGRPAIRQCPTEPVPIGQPAAAAWLVRRAVWQRLGGLNEGFVPAWWEDVDFCARLQRALGTTDFPATQGFFVIPKARIHHEGGSSVDSLGRPGFLTAFYGNLMRYASIHHRERIGLIGAALRLSLRMRMVLNPDLRQDYRDVIKTLSS